MMKKKLNKTPLVSVIILTYKNGAKNIERCLSSLVKVKYPKLEMIIVDNGSTDDTLSRISNFKYPRPRSAKRGGQISNIKLIKNKKNLGFCEGNNRAVKIAKGKYVLLLNNDTKVTPDFLNVLVRDLEEDESIGVVQPKIRQLIETEKLDACASFLTWTGFPYHYGYSQKQSMKKYNRKMYMYSAKGACFLTRKSLIDRIGLFDKDYFAYFEETDFCHRVWMSGSKVLYEPTSEIFHLGGADKGQDHPRELQFISYRNRIQTYIKNLEFKYLMGIFPIHIITLLATIFTYAILGRMSISQEILKAIFWNVLNFQKILKKRKNVQALRNVPENKYIREIMKNPKISYYYHFLINPRGLYNENL